MTIRSGASFAVSHVQKASPSPKGMNGGGAAGIESLGRAILGGAVRIDHHADAGTQALPLTIAGFAEIGVAELPGALRQGAVALLGLPKERAPPLVIAQLEAGFGQVQEQRRILGKRRDELGLKLEEVLVIAAGPQMVTKVFRRNQGRAVGMTLDGRD